MKQFGKILKFELNSYLKNKTFVGITVFLVAVIAIVMFAPRVISLFDNGEDAEGDRSVMLVKVAGDIEDSVALEIFSSTFSDYNVLLTDDTVDTIKERIVADEAKCAFVLASSTEYTYYVNNLTMYDMNAAAADEVLRQIYQMGIMMNGGMTPEAAAETLNVQINGTTESLGKDQMRNFFYTYIMIFALYMVILLYGQMIAMNVATEKSSRAMEVLVTSVKPISMMFGKVIASCIAGLAQLVAIFGSALLLFNVNKPYWGDNEIIDMIFNIPPELFVYMLIFFLLGFLIYAFLFGALASTVSKLEDINTAIQPVTYLFVFGFIVVMFSMTSQNVDNLLMRVCSYIPFTSPMAMFTRIAMSNVPLYEILICIAILAVSVVATGIISAKIYRMGVLMYGNKPTLKEIFKLLRKA